jgi:hypothetical protein
VEIIKPKPTRFNGITFRSKSEAIMAVALHQSRNLIWLYEPSIFGFDFLVDFLLTFETGHKKLSMQLLEYKPKKPSKSYIKHACECFERFKESGSPLCSFTIDLTIVWGCPFKDEKLDAMSCAGLDHRGLVACVNTNWAWAKDYRFDLEE